MNSRKLVFVLVAAVGSGTTFGNVAHTNSSLNKHSEWRLERQITSRILTDKNGEITRTTGPVAHSGNVRCTLDRARNRLVYTRGKEREEVELDTKLVEPSRIVCTPQFTAILDSGRLVITLGAQRVMGDKPALGSRIVLGGRWGFATSYILPLTTQSLEGIDSIRIRGPELEVVTRTNRWTGDLIDPRRWEVEQRL